MAFDPVYFKGVGIGLLITWVTSGLALWRAGNSSLPKLVVLEFVLSVAFLVVGFWLRA